MKFLTTRRCGREFVGLDGRNYRCNLPTVHGEGSLAPGCMRLDLTGPDRALFRGIVREHEQPGYNFYAAGATR